MCVHVCVCACMCVCVCVCVCVEGGGGGGGAWQHVSHTHLQVKHGIASCGLLLFCCDAQVRSVDGMLFPMYYTMVACSRCIHQI